MLQKLSGLDCAWRLRQLHIVQLNYGRLMMLSGYSQSLLGPPCFACSPDVVVGRETVDLSGLELRIVAYSGNIMTEMSRFTK